MSSISSSVDGSRGCDPSPGGGGGTFLIFFMGNINFVISISVVVGAVVGTVAGAGAGAGADASPVGPDTTGAGAGAGGPPGVTWAGTVCTAAGFGTVCTAAGADLDVIYGAIYGETVIVGLGFFAAFNICITSWGVIPGVDLLWLSSLIISGLFSVIKVWNHFCVLFICSCDVFNCSKSFGSVVCLDAKLVSKLFCCFCTSINRAA